MAEHKEEQKVIFFGDSLIRYWLINGEDYWTKYYKPRSVCNFGYPGEGFQQLIWRMEEGQFNGLDSKLVVLLIGTNNLGYNTEIDIAQGIRDVLEQIMKRQPNAKVLLLGLLPRGVVDTKIARINKTISTLEDKKRVFFLDMTKHFETSPGNVIKELYEHDKLHLSSKGYQVWYEVMEPLFSKLL